MKLFKILFAALIAYVPTAWSAVDYNIKYSSNYLMPAYVHFKADGSQYSVNAKINIPLYNIVFTSRGSQTASQFKMVNYQDVRNGKPYAISKISPTTIEYGKVKNGLETEPLKLPTFDLFTMHFSWAITINCQPVSKLQTVKNFTQWKMWMWRKWKNRSNNNKQTVTEITYSFKTGNKDIMVKKFSGEQFPRYIKYTRDGDDYELEFDEFVK